MKITVKADPDIMVGLAKWALAKVKEDWDQPIVHDLLDTLGIGAVRDPETDTMGSGGARLEKVLSEFIAADKMAKDQAVKKHDHHEAMREIFGKICNQENWKKPIDAVISPKDAELAREAIVFMTGSPDVVVTPASKKGMLRIRASGYYASVGA